jgi:hypothetical protein
MVIRSKARVDWLRFRSHSRKVYRCGSANPTAAKGNHGVPVVASLLLRVRDRPMFLPDYVDPFDFCSQSELGVPFLHRRRKFCALGFSERELPVKDQLKPGRRRISKTDWRSPVRPNSAFRLLQGRKFCDFRLPVKGNSPNCLRRKMGAYGLISTIRETLGPYRPGICPVSARKIDVFSRWLAEERMSETGWRSG